jgi:hypothetical protein
MTRWAGLPETSGARTTAAVRQPPASGLSPFASGLAPDDSGSKPGGSGYSLTKEEKALVQTAAK